MRLPNPLIRANWLYHLPGGRRLQRWRITHGVLTGRWTQAEIDDQKRRAHEHYLRLKEHFE